MFCEFRAPIRKRQVNESPDVKHPQRVPLPHGRPARRRDSSYAASVTRATLPTSREAPNPSPPGTLAPRTDPDSPDVRVCPDQGHGVPGACCRTSRARRPPRWTAAPATRPRGTRKAPAFACAEEVGGVLLPACVPERAHDHARRAPAVGVVVDGGGACVADAPPLGVCGGGRLPVAASPTTLNERRRPSTVPRFPCCAANHALREARRTCRGVFATAAPRRRPQDKDHPAARRGARRPNEH